MPPAATNRLLERLFGEVTIASLDGALSLDEVYLGVELAPGREAITVHPQPDSLTPRTPPELDVSEQKSQPGPP